MESPKLSVVNYQPSPDDRITLGEYPYVYIKGNPGTLSSKVARIWWERSPFPCFITEDQTIYKP